MSRSTGRPSLASIRKDYGFFGPGSATWKVWSYPTSPTVGFERAVVIEELDPFLVASVQHSGAVKARTRLRYDRTLQYFATVMFGDSESVLNAAEILMKIHGKAIGPEPVTGGQFDANDPASISPPGTRSCTAMKNLGRAGSPKKRKTGIGKSARSPPSSKPLTRRTYPEHDRVSASTSRTTGPDWSDPNPRRT
jgi:hypothetical protein